MNTFTIVIVDLHDVPDHLKLVDAMRNQKEDELIQCTTLVQSYKTNIDTVGIIRVGTLYSTAGIEAIEKLRRSEQLHEIACWCCEKALSKVMGVDTYILRMPASDLLPVVKQICKKPSNFFIPN